MLGLLDDAMEPGPLGVCITAMGGKYSPGSPGCISSGCLYMYWCRGDGFGVRRCGTSIIKASSTDWPPG